MGADENIRTRQGIVPDFPLRTNEDEKIRLQQECFFARSGYASGKIFDKILFLPILPRAFPKSRTSFPMSLALSEHPKLAPVTKYSPLPAVCDRFADLCPLPVRSSDSDAATPDTRLEYRARLTEALRPLIPLIRRFPADLMSPRGLDSKLRGSAANLKSFVAADSEEIRIFAIAIGALHIIGQGMRYAAHQTARMIMAGREGVSPVDSAPSFRESLATVREGLESAGETFVATHAFFSDSERFASVSAEFYRLREELCLAAEYANTRPPTDTAATNAKDDAQATLDRFWKNNPDLVEYEFYRFVFGSESPLLPACRSLEGLLRVDSLGAGFERRLDIVLAG
jgi:hypothetical protein